MIALLLLLLDPLFQDPSLEGTWTGTLEVQSFKLRVAFHVSSKQGSLAATMDSIDQGVHGIAVESVELKDGAVTIKVPSIGGVFEGRLEEALTIRGTWSQSGISLPLELRKVDKPPELNRPQTPKPPFPYDVEEVSYENRSAGVKFAGTLTKPRGDGPFPAMLLISGSGAQDRDSALFGHKPFLVLADALTRQGYAVLRVDDRGVGGSTGSVLEATIDDLVADALTGVAFLKARTDVDGRRIGLIGHSEGGWVAPLAATRSKDVAFLVMIAGPGLSGEEILHLQTEVILRAAGTADDAILRNRTAMERIYAEVKKESDGARARERIQEIYQDLLAGLTEEQARTARAQMEAQIQMLTSRWFRSILTYDPRPALKQVTCAVLAILGEKDLQVPAEQNRVELLKAFEGNQAARVEVLQGHNHLMQRCKTGLPAEYGLIEETLSPTVLELILEWVAQQSR